MNKTISSLMTVLFLMSIGIAEWTYGPNLIANGDFNASELTILTQGENLILNGNFSAVRSDNESLPANWTQQDWADCSLTTDSPAWDNSQLKYIVGEYTNVTMENANDVELESSPVYLEKAKTYYLSLDFFYYGYSAAVYFVNNVSGCTNAMPEVLEWNDTAVQPTSPMTNGNVVSIGDGWYRMTGYLNVSGLESDAQYALLIFGWSIEGAYLLDNVVLSEVTTATIPQNWSLPDYTWGQTDYVDGMLNISIDGQGYQTAPFQLTNSTPYEFLIDYKVGGDYPMDAESAAPIGIYSNKSWGSYLCDDFFLFLAFNNTDWGQYNGGCAEYPQLFETSSYIEDLGDGWTQLHAYLNMTKTNFSDFSDQFFIVLSTSQVSPTLFDNIALRNMTKTEEPAEPTITPTYTSIFSVQDIPKQVVDFIGGILDALANSVTAIVWIIVAGIVIGLAVELIKKAQELGLSDSRRE